MVKTIQQLKLLCKLQTNPMPSLSVKKLLSSSRIILVVVIGQWLVACDSVDDDWRQAQNLDTEEAYRLFMAKHPNSEYEQAAYEHIEYINWQTATTTGTNESFNAYLKKYKQGRFVDIALMKLDDLAWATARDTNTLPAYRAYLEQYPDTKKLSGLTLSAKSQWLNASPLTNQLKGNLAYKISLANFRKSGPFKNAKVGNDYKLMPEKGRRIWVSGTIVSRLGNTIRKRATANRWEYIYQDGVIVDWAICATQGEVILPVRHLFGFDQKKTTNNQFTATRLGKDLVHITLNGNGDKLCFELRNNNEEIYPAIYGTSKLITQSSLFSKQNEQWKFEKFIN